MSVSFWAEHSPQVEEVFECCDTEETEEGLGPCPHCHGAGKVTFQRNELEVNFSNSNAQAVLRLLGFDDPEAYLGGSLSETEIPGVLRQITRLLNVEGSLTSEVRPATVERSERREVVHEGGWACIKRSQGATLIQGGRDETYLKEALTRLQTLLGATLRQKAGPIHWA